MPLQKERKLYLELLRAIAIFLVVLNHNSAYAYYLQVPQLPVRLLFSGLSALVKTAVPLFFMISGATLKSMSAIHIGSSLSPISHLVA